MPNTLSERQVAFYREQGYLFPFDGIEADDAGAMRADLESFENDAGFSASDITLKGHLCFRRSYDICFHWFNANYRMVDGYAIHVTSWCNLGIFVYWRKLSFDGK